VPSSVLAISAFFAVALLPRATWPLIDPDVWWHIRAGEATIAGGVPRVDSWSLTAAGHPWTTQDWLANAAMALVYRLGPWGETLLSLVFAAVAVLAFVILWKAVTVRQAATGWLSRAVWFSAALLLAGPILGVRVQVLDLLLTAIVLWVLWKVIATRQTRWLIGLPMISIAWVNLHAGWPLLFLLGAALLVGEVVDAALRRHVSGRPPLRARELVWIAVALLASALVLAVNPNGADIYRYPFDTLSLGTLKGAIGEWQPARLDNLFGWLLVAFVIVAVIPTLLFARARLRTADALMLLGLTAMSVLAIRFLLILGPIGAAIIIVALGPTISASRIGVATAPLLRRLATPRSGTAGAVNAALAVLLLLLGMGIATARTLPPTQAEEIAKTQPVAAVDWINANDPGARVFNQYEWGGYLGLRRPEAPIYIDGRADVYGDQIIAEYVRTIGLSIDPQSTFDKYAIDYVLFPPDTPLAGWLDASAEWKHAYRDQVAAVWVRA
jgi:hypothetical protein